MRKYPDHCKHCGRPIPRIACYSVWRVTCSRYCQKQLQKPINRVNKEELYSGLKIR